MRILYVDDDDCIRTLYTMTLENMLKEVSIRECISGNQAVKIIEQEEMFDLIICDYEMPQGNGDILYNYLLNNKNETPFVLLTAFELKDLDSYREYLSKNPKSIYLNKNRGVAGFKKEVTKLILNFFKDVSFIDEEYKSVRILNFLRFNKSLCDVYVKLSAEKYVKIINKSSHYIKSDIDKYFKRNLRHFHIRREDYEVFGTSLKNLSFLIFDQEGVKNGGEEDQLVATHYMIHEILKSVGLSTGLLSMAQRSVEQLTKKTRSNKDLLKLLKKSRSRRGYLYDHSYLISCICCNMCSKMSWGTTEISEKLSMASIFHDLILDDPELAMISFLKDKKLESFSKKDRDLFFNHPLLMGEMIRNSKFFISDVDIIIEQHHERPDGTGFPRGLQLSTISRLSCIFIIAHDFVDKLYEADFDENKLEEILISLNKEYNVGNFRDPISAFVHSFGGKYEKIF